MSFNSKVSKAYVLNRLVDKITIDYLIHEGSSVLAIYAYPGIHGLPSLYWYLNISNKYYLFVIYICSRYVGDRNWASMVNILILIAV